MRETCVVVLYGSVLPVTGDGARYLTLPDGTRVELHPGPARPEHNNNPFALVPDSWLT